MTEIIIEKLKLTLNLLKTAGIKSNNYFKKQIRKWEKI